MEEPSYKFNRIEDKLTFEFDSISSAKTIRKRIEFSLINKDYALYNLALVDIMADGTSTDLSKSNNQDMPVILSTVFQSVVYFFNRNPKARILIQGSTKSRTRLYQMAIAKYLEEIEQKFNISGYKDIKGEVFKKGENYDSFVVSIK